MTSAERGRSTRRFAHRRQLPPRPEPFDTTPLLHLLWGRRATLFSMTERIIDLASPEIGAELLRDPKGSFPIDVWRCYILHHHPISPFDPPASVIYLCDERPRSTLQPQKAVDEAWELLVDQIYASPPRSRGELMKGIWDAQLVLHRAHSTGRRRGQPTSMQCQAVRAYVIRKFNPDSSKPGESTVSWAKLADLLFAQNGKCARCGVARHQYETACVKALITAVRRLEHAMKRDGIPT